MVQYKMIKNFCELTKGDMFTPSENIKDSYEMHKQLNVGGYNVNITSTIDGEYADELVEQGYAIKLGEEGKTPCGCCDRLREVEEFIDELMEQYTKDHDALVESYDEGCLQPCVKVEADTVYYNMQKLLKAIKNKINE